MLLEGAGALSHRIDQSTSNILIELEATARGIHLSIHHPEAEDLSSMMEIWIIIKTTCAQSMCFCQYETKKTDKVCFTTIL